MDNRQTILTCTIQLFADRGYDAVGVQEIAESAGVTKPTLYHYFGSKQGLLDTLLESHFSLLNAAVREAAVYRKGDLQGTLTNVALTFFNFAHENPNFYRFSLALWFAPRHSDAQAAVLHWFDEQHQVIERLFQQATRDHGNMAGRQRDYTATFIGMINTYIGLALNGYTVLDRSLAYKAVRQFQHGIYS